MKFLLSCMNIFTTVLLQQHRKAVKGSEHDAGKHEEARQASGSLKAKKKKKSTGRFEGLTVDSRRT